VNEDEDLGYIVAEEQASLDAARARVAAIVAQQEAERRDTELEAQRKADKAKRDVEGAIVLLFLWRRRRAAQVGGAVAQQQLLRLRRQELAVTLGAAAQSKALLLQTAKLEQAAKSYAEALGRAAQLRRESRIGGSLARASVSVDWRLERMAHAEIWGTAQREIGRIQRRAGALDPALMREWVATLDKRTCKACKSLDGTRVRASETFEVEPPAHGFCRCSTRLTTDLAERISA
jgi:Phage Mu protein F like protein